MKYKNQEYIEVKTPRVIWDSVEILNFLYGRKIDDIALAYVSGFNPTSIRSIYSTEHLDARTGRVTIYLDENDIITKIRQEMSLHAPDSIKHGEHLRICMKYGIDSPQAEWYRDNSITGYIHEPNGYYKICKDGTIKFPSDDN